MRGDSLQGELNNAQQFTTVVPSGDNSVVPLMTAHNVNITVAPVDDNMPTLVSVAINWFPMLLLIGVWSYIMRQMQAAAKGDGLRKSRAKLLTERQGRVTFEDVAGVDEAKDDLKEIVDSCATRRIPAPWRTNSQGRFARWPAGYGQDASGTRYRGRGECAVLYDLRFRLCRDVRGRWRQPRARYVRAGEEECALHCLRG